MRMAIQLVLVLCLGIFMCLAFFLFPVKSYAVAEHQFEPEDISALSHPRPPILYTYDVVNTFLHDPEAFTQGLLYDSGDILYESTGLYGASTVRVVDLQTGNVQQQRRMGRKYFGEGLTLLAGRLHQVVWLSNELLLYDPTTLAQLGSTKTPMKDGWGLATDGVHLIGSEGSPTIYFMDPDTFQEVRRIEVNDAGAPVTYLNELEYIDGEIWANVWQTECIARIDPETGLIKGWVLLHGLMTLAQRENRPRKRAMDVLNGIAFDPRTGRIFVTGKFWPRLYEVKVRPIQGAPNMDLETTRSRCIINRGRGGG